MKTVKVVSNYGELAVDWETGNVVSFTGTDEAGTCYMAAICHVNVAEWREYYGVKDQPEVVDILDLGFTEIVEGEMVYLSPDSDWRTLKRNGFDLYIDGDTIVANGTQLDTKKMPEQIADSFLKLEKMLKEK